MRQAFSLQVNRVKIPLKYACIETNSELFGSDKKSKLNKNLKHIKMFSFH